MGYFTFLMGYLSHSFPKKDMQNIFFKFGFIYLIIKYLPAVRNAN